MADSTASRFFRKRNILGAVLVAGIATGIYLGDFFKGLGWGPGNGGRGNSTSTKESKEAGDGDGAADKTKTVASAESVGTWTAPKQDEPDSTTSGPAVIKIVIADRSYFVRSTAGDEETDLKKIVALANAAKGDEDGIRIRIYRKLSSRTAAELALRDALVNGGITDEQTVWVANPVDD